MGKKSKSGRQRRLSSENVGSVRLFVKVRSQGSRIESLPLKSLVSLSECKFRDWSFVDGWLVLRGVS